MIAVAPYRATLTWTPSTDNSGQLSDVFCCANTSSQTAPGNVDTFVYTNGLEANRSFTLRMYAVDAAGNYSKPSNSVTFTTPVDTVPPGSRSSPSPASAPGTSRSSGPPPTTGRTSGIRSS